MIVKIVYCYDETLKGSSHKKYFIPWDQEGNQILKFR